MDSHESSSSLPRWLIGILLTVLLTALATFVVNDSLDQRKRYRDLQRQFEEFRTATDERNKKIFSIQNELVNSFREIKDLLLQISTKEAEINKHIDKVFTRIDSSLGDLRELIDTDLADRDTLNRNNHLPGGRSEIDLDAKVITGQAKPGSEPLKSDIKRLCKNTTISGLDNPSDHQIELNVGDLEDATVARPSKTKTRHRELNEFDRTHSADFGVNDLLGPGGNNEGVDLPQKSVTLRNTILGPSSLSTQTGIEKNRPPKRQTGTSMLTPDSLAAVSKGRLIRSPSGYQDLSSVPMQRDISTIKEAVLKHNRMVRHYYSSILKDDPDVGGGRLEVRAVISPSGKVVSAIIKSSTLGHGLLENIILEKISQWNFGQVDVQYGNSTIIIPYVFGHYRGKSRPLDVASKGQKF